MPMAKRKRTNNDLLNIHINVQIKYMYCFLLHICISFNPRTTHQTSQSQAMQVWTHWRPRSPLHTSLDLLSALHLNHGHSRASPVSGWGKRGGKYFTCYGRNLISNWIFSMKAKTKCQVASLFVSLFLFIYVLFLQAIAPRVNSKWPTPPHTHLPIHF
jgi:hypothetical protein